MGDGGSEQPYLGHERYLFVSYARDDASRVLPIVEALRRGGIRLWWDTAIQAGEKFGTEIQRKLDSSAGVVVFLSERALQSDWILSETKHAKESGKELIPVKLDRTSLTVEWNALIGRFQSVDAERRSPETVADEMRRRANALECGGPRTNGMAGETMPQPATSNTVPWIIVLVMAVIATVFATLHFSGNRDSSGANADDRAPVRASESQRGAANGPSTVAQPPLPKAAAGDPPRTFAPEIPEGFLEDIGDQPREWRWSKSGAFENNEVVLHWERCKGVEKMRDVNAAVLTGRLDEVRAATARLPLRACRFCYEIELNRTMDKSSAPVIGK